MVLVVLRGYYLQVAHQERVSVPLTLEKLAVVLHIVDAGEDLLKVAQSELFLLKVQDYLQVILCAHVFFTLEDLSHEFAKVGVR